MKIHAGAYQHAVANLEKERKELYRQIYEAVRSCTPGWSESTLDEISITQVGGAMTNFIFIVSKPEGLNHKVLLRIYGEGTDLFFPRDREINTFQMLSERNIGIKFLGEFDNGRVERLIEGTTCTPLDIRKPDISAAIAAKVYQLHSLDIPGLEKSPQVVNKTKEFLKKARELFTGPRFAKEVVDFDAVEANIGELEQLIQSVESPVAFCHSDLQYGNIMMTPALDDVVLIDFEYSDYNPRGFDIGSHFCEWAFDYTSEMPHVGDFTKYPTIEQQRHFCRHYLEARGDKEPVTEVMVEELRHEASIYAQVSHLFWGLWGFIQATQSEIDFDYLAYGTCRINAFRTRQGLKNPR